MPGVGARPAEGGFSFSGGGSSRSTPEPFDEACAEHSRSAQDLRRNEEGMPPFGGIMYAVGDTYPHP